MKSSSSATPTRSVVATRDRPTRCFIRIAPAAALTAAAREANRRRRRGSLPVNSEACEAIGADGPQHVSLPSYSAEGYRRQVSSGPFDGVFSSADACVETDASTYDAVGTPLVDLALKGESSCCFAYGHTGTGKTYTAARCIA